MKRVRIPVPLVGPSATARAIGQNPERTVNLYPEQAVANAKAPVALLQTPGRTELGRFDSPIRGWHVMDERLFAICGNGVFELYSDGTVRGWATINTVAGRVELSDNNSVLVIGDGASFYTFDPVTAICAPVLIEGTEPLRGTFSAFLDQATLYLQRESQRVYYSDLTTPGTVQGARFFEAEVSPDKANCLIVDREEIYIGGPLTIQPFYDAGVGNILYQSIGSGVIPGGVAAPFSAQAFDNAIVYVGTGPDGGGRVQRLNGPGSSPVRISTHAVERAITRQADPSTITAFVYEEEGHLFYVLNLDDITWAYDAVTNQWHERAVLSYLTGNWQRDRAELHAFAYGQHWVADYKTGQYYVQSIDILTQELHPIIRRRTFPVDTKGQRATFDELAIDMKVGVGLDGIQQGTDPEAMLRYSDDGGRTWSEEIWEPIGRIGETLAQVRFTRLGSAYDRVFELSISDPVEVQLLRAWATIRVG